MRVYKFLTTEFAMKDIWERRMKISEISDLNDPFELIPCDLSDPEHLYALLATRDLMTRTRGLLCFSRSWMNPSCGHTIATSIEGCALASICRTI